MKATTRSPLKAANLRQPGQSLQEEIDKLFNDGVAPHLAVALSFMTAAFLQWYQYLFKLPPSPLLFTFIMVLAFALFFYKFFRAKEKAKHLKLGRDGERAVAECLDTLREDGYRLLHDVVGGSFNLDHVLIGPAGVFTVETKTASKPSKGDARVRVEGETIRVSMYEPDRNPITQAKAQAGWLRELLEDTTGKTYKVQPIVAYPGWFVEGDQWGEVWVLEPKALHKVLGKRKPVLDKTDIALVTSSLKRFVRSSAR